MLQCVWYIQWIINLPLLLLSVLLVTGFSLFDILVTLFAAVVLVLCGLIRDYTTSSYGHWFSWIGSFAFGYVMYVIFVSPFGCSLSTSPYRYVLLVQGTKSAYEAGDAFGKRYLFSASFLALTLLGHTLSFALAHSAGPDALSPEALQACNGILDGLAQPVFLFFFLHQLNKINPGSICGAISLSTDDDDVSSLEEFASRRLRRHHRRY